MALIENPTFFFVMLPLFLMVYWAAKRKPDLQLMLLLIGSIVFYAWGNLINGLLLIALIALDFFAARYRVSDGRKGDFLLSLTLAINLLVWVAFKYFTPALPSPFNATYPAGISYFMLKKLAFLINQFHRKEEQSWRFIDYSIYVAFFPQILSGPIQPPDSFIEQLNEKKSLRMTQILHSAKLFLLGFLKKIAIADNLGLLVNRVFQLESPSLLLGFTGGLGFSVQLFADFSAYTDISRGVSILMGFDPPKNFNAPFLATSPQGFWNRWHITLSSWLRTYIFNPVRRKLIRVWPKARPIHIVIPALAAMLASGLWHGNTSRFLIWGLYHGIILIVFRGAEKQLKTFIPMREFPFLKWILTFVLMMIGWLLFRGRSASWALDIIFNSRPGISGDEFVTAVSILSMIFMYSIPLMLYRLIDYSGKIKRVLEPAYFLLALVVLVVFSASGVQDFLYFEF